MTRRRRTCCGSSTAGAFLAWDNTLILTGQRLSLSRRARSRCCSPTASSRPAAVCMVGAFAAICARVTSSGRARSGCGAPAQPGPAALLRAAWRSGSPGGGRTRRLTSAPSSTSTSGFGGWRAGLDLGCDLLPALTLNPANNPAGACRRWSRRSPRPSAPARLQRAPIRRLAPRADRASRSTRRPRRAGATSAARAGAA